MTDKHVTNPFLVNAPNEKHRSPKWVTELSAAEKYDALIRDRNSALMHHMWATNQKTFDDFDKNNGCGSMHFFVRNPKKYFKYQ